MRELSYEINAFEHGASEGIKILCGRGKRAKAKACERANEMWYTGKYEAVFVDALNDEEIIDDECVNIPYKA